MKLDTKAGVLAYAERRRAEMVRCFERMGRFEDHGQSFCAVLFATHELLHPKKGPLRADDWRTGERLAAPKAVDIHLPPLVQILMLENEQQKDAFAHLVREYGKKVKAMGVLFLTETWWAHVGSPGQTKEEVMAERAARPKSLEDWDDRREGLFMQLQHPATGNVAWFNEIKRNPTRLLGWEEKDLTDSEGRFVDLIEKQS